MTSLPPLGLDIAKDTFEAHLRLSARGRHKRFANTPAG
jgi:hypothetical protein